MSNENKVGAMEGIGTFLAKNKAWTNFFYGVGAAVVLVGALFKILHLPGAAIMLCIGMGTEVCLFLLSAFEPPHKEYHWEKVYPGLMGADDEVGEPVAIQHASSAPVQGAPVPVGNLASLASMDVSSGEVSKMSDGIKKFGDLADSLTSIDEFTLANKHLVQSMKSAADSVKILDQSSAQSGKDIAEGASQLSSSYSKIVTAFESDFAQVTKDTKDYGESLSTMATKLSSINAVYELQLKSVNEQLHHLESLGHSVTQMNDAFAGSVPDAHAYKLGAERLKSQIENLNSVYGNMLNALTASV